jgi:hypothetical protein
MKCEHDWIAVGFPLVIEFENKTEKHKYVKCTKCGAAKSSKKRKIEKDEHIAD